MTSKPLSLETLSEDLEYFVLDASALLNSPLLDNYRQHYPDLPPRKAVFVLTTVCLDEVDKKLNSPNKDTFVKSLLEKTRGDQQLSAGVPIGAEDSGDTLWFLGSDITSKSDFKIHAQLAWMGDRYMDKYILNLALLLKEDMGLSVSVLSADSMISVLCREYGVGHTYIPKLLAAPSPRSETSTVAGTELNIETRDGSTANAAGDRKNIKLGGDGNLTGVSGQASNR